MVVLEFESESESNFVWNILLSFVCGFGKFRLREMSLEKDISEPDYTSLLVKLGLVWISSHLYQ